MDIHQKNKKRFIKNGPMLTLAIATLFVLYAGLAWSQSWWPFNKTDSVSDNTSTTSSLNSQDDQKTQSQTDADNKKDYVDSQPSDNTSQPGTSTPASGQISLTAYQQDNSTVVITTKLVSVSDGICTLVITNSDKQITLTADVLYQPEYSMCAGFSTPISSLGVGSWKLSLKVVTTSSQEYSTEGKITVK